MNVRIIWIIVTLLISIPAKAGIKFKEVTQSANVNYIGSTVGTSWGDFNRVCIKMEHSEMKQCD